MEWIQEKQGKVKNKICEGFYLGYFGIWDATVTGKK